MGQAQINVRTRACSRTSIARTKQAALTHNVRGKELNQKEFRIATVAMFTSNLNAGVVPQMSPPPHDLERLRTTGRFYSFINKISFHGSRRFIFTSSCSATHGLLLS